MDPDIFWDFDFRQDHIGPVFKMQTNGNGLAAFKRSFPGGYLGNFLENQVVREIIDFAD